MGNPWKLLFSFQLTPNLGKLSSLGLKFIIKTSAGIKCFRETIFLLCGEFDQTM